MHLDPQQIRPLGDADRLDCGYLHSCPALLQKARRSAAA
jgi:hypothetical protein